MGRTKIRVERNFAFLLLCTDESCTCYAGLGFWVFYITIDGDAVAARRGRLVALLEPLQGEIIACIQGVQAAIDAGVGQVIIETE